MFNTIKVNNTDTNYTHSIFDISEYTGKTYDTLSDALADVPDGKQKGGMTVCYETDGNKYVQYRLMTDTFNTTESNWQGVDEEPTNRSNNFVKSGGIFNALKSIVQEVAVSTFDVDNLKSGILGFSSTIVPSGLPNINYGAGAFIITTRASDTALTTHDKQFLITINAIYVRMCNSGTWGNWMGYDYNSRISDINKKLDNLTATESFIAGQTKWAFGQALSQISGGSVFIDFESDEPVYCGIYDNGTWLVPQQVWKGSKYITIPSGHMPTAFVRNSGENTTNITIKILRKSDLVNHIVDNLNRIDEEVGKDLFNFSAPTGNAAWETNTNLKNQGNGLVNFSSSGRIQIGVYDATTSKFLINPKEWKNWEYIEIPDGHTINIHKKSLEETNVNVICSFAKNSSISSIAGNLLSKINDNASKIRTNITVGVNGDYQTLRAAIEYAYTKGNTTITVTKGTYDILQEFATEIAAHTGGATGNKLGKGMELIFLPGSYVTCLYELSGDSAKDTWMNTYFNPFYAEYGDYIIENLNIKASNCRYCVHDELSGQDLSYIHKYINCRMQQQTDAEGSPKVQCIGGGFGQRGQIVVDGGYYKSIPTENMSSVPTISWHTNTNCDSRITIKDVYLADNGCFKFGDYANSNTPSFVEVCGCSMGAAIVTGPEVSGSHPTAVFVVTEWNNIIRS